MKPHRIFSTAIICTVILAGVASCNKNKDKITGIWQLKLMDIKGANISGSSLGDWLWEFNQAGGYLTDIAGAKEKGRYQLEGGKLTLRPFDTKNRPAVVYNIAFLDSSEMDLVSSDPQTPTKFYFFKRSAADVTEDKD